MDIIGKSPIPLPVLILGKTAFAGCAFFLITGLMMPGTVLFGSGLTRTAGVILCAAGFATVVVSLVHLGRSAAVGLPERETELKTTGLYRYSRNPVYLGAFVLCAGSCLISPHPANFLSFGIAFAVHLRIVKREEEFLERRFGKRWLDYKRRVPRFVGIPRRAGRRA